MSKFKILTIPFDSVIKEFKNELIERNMLNKKILNYKVELLKDEGKFYWSVFFEYEDLDGMINISKESKTLNEGELKLLDILKEWRKNKATEKGFPTYVIAKNEQLLEIIKTCPKTLSELQNINGIGEKKSKEYGEEIIGIIKKFHNVGD